MANLDPNTDPNRSYGNRNMDYQPVDRGVGAGAWIAGLLALILVVGAIFYMVNRGGDTTATGPSSSPPATTGSAPSGAPATTGSGGTTTPPAQSNTPPAQSK